jgi:hypothetical protein
LGRRRLALVLLACALVASTGLRVAAGADKRGITHDESISMLAAACHQGDYTRLTFAAEPPFGRWVPAAEWKALLRPERPLCLATIARDLASEDIHPPLYFWLLHGWTLVLGVGVWTGLSLNIVLAAVTGLGLFGLARRVLGGPLKAAGVTAVWSLSPGAIRVFAEARQYELLALFAVLFLWQCVRFCDPPTRAPRRDAALLAAVTAAGALAQFLFALVAAAGAALLVVRLWSTRRGLLAWGLASIGAGYALFTLVHSGFVLSLGRGREQATDPALELLGTRVEQTLDTLAEFLLPPALAQGPAAYAGAAALLAMAVLALATSAARRPGRLSPAAMVLVFLWLAGAHAALFLSFLSPASAMGYKHLSSVWPFAAFVPVLALAAAPRRARTAIAAAGGAALAVAGAIGALGHFPDPRPAPPLERADAVLIDNVARGVLPRIVWRLDDDTRVFAADQGHLLANPAAWLPGLKRGDVYVGRLPPSDPRYGNSPARGRWVAAAIAARHRLQPVPDQLEPGRVFVLGEPSRPGGRTAR